jgi:hypothetical protein
MEDSWENLKVMALEAQENEPRDPTLPLWLCLKLEGPEVERDGYIWISNELSPKTIKCYSKQLKGPIMKYSSTGAEMALLELFWNKIVSLAQGQAIIIKGTELNEPWATNHTKKMVGITTTTWDKWRNVHATKGVMFISDQGWDTDEPGPGPTTVKEKSKENKTGYRQLLQCPGHDF